MNTVHKVLFAAVAGAMIFVGDVSAAETSMSDYAKKNLQSPMMMSVLITGARQTPYLNQNSKEACDAMVGAAIVGEGNPAQVIITGLMSKGVGELADTSYGQAAADKMPAQEYEKTRAWLWYVAKTMGCVVAGSYIGEGINNAIDSSNPSPHKKS